MPLCSMASVTAARWLASISGSRSGATTASAARRAEGVCSGRGMSSPAWSGCVVTMASKGRPVSVSSRSTTSRRSRDAMRGAAQA